MLRAGRSRGTWGDKCLSRARSLFQRSKAGVILRVQSSLTSSAAGGNTLYASCLENCVF